MNVTLRERKMKSGKIKLYLDFYHKGKRWHESLGIFLTGDRLQDKELRRLASAIRAKKELEIKNDEHGFTPTFKREASFFEFFEKVKATKDGNLGAWRSTLFHLKNFTNGEPLRFMDITPQWLEELKAYLLSQVAPNTARGYYAAVRGTLKKAVKEGIIPSDPSEKVENIRGRDTYRPYLTHEELTTLARTACPDEEVKRAFLFSCYTGLRLGDVRSLTWLQVHSETLELVQQKTKEPMYLPLSSTAQKLLGGRGKPEEPIFSIPSDSHLSVIMKTWSAQAGITKKVTFHTARHTFATLALTSGAEIYTVSKLLGHSRLETTQVYAKIIDSKKTQAVNLLPEIEVM